MIRSGEVRGVRFTLILINFNIILYVFISRKTFCRDKCSLRGASEGILFPRHITPDMDFPIYRKSFCRTLRLTYNGTGEMYNGYPVYFYTFLPDVFNSSLDENRCYCPSEGCLPSGLSDISSCHYGEYLYRR